MYGFEKKVICEVEVKLFIICSLAWFTFNAFTLNKPGPKVKIFINCNRKIENGSRIE